MGIMIAGLVLVLPAVAESAILTGRVIRVEPEFNKMVLAQYDALGNVNQWDLAWQDVSSVDPVLDSAPVGFEVSVSAERNFFDTWEVREVLSGPSAPRRVVLQVVRVIDAATGRVEMRDPVTVQSRTMVFEPYKLEGLKPGSNLTVDVPLGIPEPRLGIPSPVR